ncbi:MAG: hypothetical protein IJH07_06325 [Ruminococcus sp.]|nr:hypothetical protein [Ruminococcus sp.]
MKKFLCLIMISLLLLSLAACSDSGSTAPDTTEPAAEAVSDNGDTGSSADSDGVDVDLTAMSSTMVYSEVLNMQQKPEDYLGKTVKMAGPFNVTEIGENRYFACIIADATACCSTGIEFVLKGDYSYPDDYPEANTEITVVGTFNTYMEGTSKYLQLKDSVMEF